MVARILPLFVLVPVLMAGWLTSQGAAKLHAVSEEEVVSYSQLLKEAAENEAASTEVASAEDAPAEDEGSETVLLATNE